MSERAFELEEQTEELMDALGLDTDDDELFLIISDALDAAYEAGQDDLLEELDDLSE